MPSLELSDSDAVEVLARGELEVLGRMPWASNATLLVVARLDGVEMQAIYKPRRGERPLWDFPGGTLCQREVATYELSDALGWGLVPPTVLRDGPVGTGMVQGFVDHDPEEHYFTLLEEHADRFLQFAVFDVLVNNADRKGGHCIRSLPDGTIVGIDHGLTVHPPWKLRTVIWDFAGDAVPPGLADDVCRALVDDELSEHMAPLLTSLEVEAMQQRAQELVRAGRLPDPDPGYHSLPWPLV